MRIHNKLFSILFLFSAVLVFTIAALVQWSFDKGMVEYVNSREATALQPFVKELANMHQEKKSWERFELNPRSFHIKIDRHLKSANSDADNTYSRPPPPHQSNRKGVNDNSLSRERNEPMHRRPPRNHLPPGPRENIVNYVLLDEQKVPVAGKISVKKSYNYIPIEAKELVVGYLAIAKRVELTEGYELDFIESQHNFLWVIALGVMCLVILVTFPLARHLVTPLRTLTTGMHQLAQGHYQHKMHFKRTDEFGDLSQDFNALASALEKSDSTRKRWLANISHELRTPVAILRGELEAMIDKIRPVSIENIASAHQEVQHLSRLIDDLQILTSTGIGAMTYHKEPINLIDFIEQESKKYHDYLAEAALAFTFTSELSDVYVYADQTRLCQLLENILNNCIKYSGSEASEVHISIALEKSETVCLSIEDNGKGVNDEALPYLFEHLYRVDDSRNRQTGGSGLGLSICAQIVEAHEGEIVAQASSLGGLAILIRLPVYS